MVDNYEFFCLQMTTNYSMSFLNKVEYSGVLYANIKAMLNWTRYSLPFFHPDKCFTMNVRSKSKPQCNHGYSMNNKPLDVKFELKNQGVLIDDNLKFSHHISEKVNIAN